MSKITFRADEDLIERIEALDASKSETMREALRTYLDAEEASDAGVSQGQPAGSGHASADASLDAILAERVDELIAERLPAREPRERRAGGRAQDVNVNVTLERDGQARATDGRRAQESEPRDSSERATDAAASHDHGTAAPTAQSASPDTPADASKACGQCGESLDDEHVYCPNCGEKAAHRVFCECGDQVRSDWAFCPSCGRRTTAADVLDGS